MNTKQQSHHGRGLIGDAINKVIDVLPFELHLPGYQYCGPGTNLSKRLKRGDPGINKLDSACKAHDIAYSRSSDTEKRAIADKELAERAWERFKASDSSWGEKSAAWAITNIMKAKNKFGSGGGGGKKRKNDTTNRKVIAMLASIKKKMKNLEGKGLYVRPYKGNGLKKKKRRRTKRN